MSILYQDTEVLKFLLIAKVWGGELEKAEKRSRLNWCLRTVARKIVGLWRGKQGGPNIHMWAVARKMAEGVRGYKTPAQPLVINHYSMINSDGSYTGTGGFQNTNTGSAINTLIEHKADCPEEIIVQGLLGMCITRQNFRCWCIGKYPLPGFWFTEEERNTFSAAEIAQIKREGKMAGIL